MLRAFALYVALMISVVVALICGSLLTLYYLNDKEYYLVETDRRLRNNVESAFNWVRENELKEGVVVKDLFSENRYSVKVTTRDWGFLNLISCKGTNVSITKVRKSIRHRRTGFFEQLTDPEKRLSFVSSLHPFRRSVHEKICSERLN